MKKILTLVILAISILGYVEPSLAVDPHGFVCDDGDCGRTDIGRPLIYLLLLGVAIVFLFLSSRMKLVLFVWLGIPTIAQFIDPSRPWILGYIPMLFVAMYTIDYLCKMFGIANEKTTEK